VLVADTERQLQVRQVIVLRAEPRSVYISEGIMPGDMVITTTLDAAIPGTPLLISGEESPAHMQDASGEGAVASAGVEQ
jgi:hypothetical protein